MTAPDELTRLAAVGARRRDRAAFLVLEAVIPAVIGGTIGWIVGGVVVGALAAWTSVDAAAVIVGTLLSPGALLAMLGVLVVVVVATVLASAPGLRFGTPARIGIAVAVQRAAAGELEDLLHHQTLLVVAIAQALVDVVRIGAQCVEQIVRAVPRPALGKARRSGDQELGAGVGVDVEHAVVVGDEAGQWTIGRADELRCGARRSNARAGGAARLVAAAPDTAPQDPGKCEQQVMDCAD